jgi:hypothetical protein
MIILIGRDLAMVCLERPILLETAKIENKEIGYYRNGKYGARFREEGAIPGCARVAAVAEIMAHSGHVLERYASAILLMSSASNHRGRTFKGKNALKFRM